MTLSELKAIVEWIRKNGRSRISDEDKAWAKSEIDKAETFRDLAKAVIGYIKTAE